MAELQKAIVERVVASTAITIERVLQELAKIGFSNLDDYVRINGEGMPVLDLSEVSRDQLAAVSQINVEETTEGGGSTKGAKRKKGAEAEAEDGTRVVRRTTFKLYDKRAALVDIGQHLGMFKKKVELTGEDGGPILTKDETPLSQNEVGRRIAFLLATAARAGKPAPAPAASKPKPKRK